MNEYTLETEARHLIRERVDRAREPHVPTVPRRTRIATRLRSIADRLDG